MRWKNENFMRRVGIYDDHDHERRPCPAGSTAVVALALEGRHRARRELAPGRPRGDGGRRARTDAGTRRYPRPVGFADRLGRLGLYRRRGGPGPRLSAGPPPPPAPREDSP